MFDIIVIGAGVNGSWTALHLARQGFKTALLDQVSFVVQLMNKNLYLVSILIFSMISNNTTTRAIFYKLTVILYILDSLSFTNGLFSNSIYISDLYTVTAMDVNNGYIDIPVTNNIGWDPEHQKKTIFLI